MRLPITVSFIFILLSTQAQVTKFSDYNELIDQIRNARVIMLGEVDHTDEESMIEKVRLVKFLHDSLGFDILAFESSIYDMYKANTLDITDVRNKLQTGVFSIWHHTETFDSLISALTNRQLTLAGFDNQICTGSEGICLELPRELENFLVKNKIPFNHHTITALANEIKSFNSAAYTISNEFDPSLLNEIIALAKAVQSASVKETPFWYQNLISIHGLFFDHYNNGIAQKNSLTFRPSDSNVRDSLMASNLMYLVDQYPNSKIVCWGASYHFANDVSGLVLADNDFSKAKPMGYYLKKKYGDEIKLIGFTDLGKAVSTIELLENIALLRNEKAVYQFSENSVGKASFLNYPTLPEGNWANVLDLGIIINSKSPVKLHGTVVALDATTNVPVPVPYALIQVSGTTKGSVANEHGAFELIVETEHIGHDISFSSIGYQPTVLKASELKDKVYIFEKAKLLDEVIVTPDKNDPVEIIRTLAANRIKSAPATPVSLTMYNYQEEKDGHNEELKIRESALLYYYENHLRENEMKISTILNYRSPTKDLPYNPWPYAPSHADFQSGYGFTINQTFKNLEIDSIYFFEKDKSLSVIHYRHLNSNQKNSGFGLTSEWQGKIIFDQESMMIRSHYKELYFKKNEAYGLYHISFNVEYFDYNGHLFPRLLTAKYQFKNEDGSIRTGKERVLITDINLTDPQKPVTAIWKYEDARSNPGFWNTFNTIPQKK